MTDLAKLLMGEVVRAGEAKDQRHPRSDRTHASDLGHPCVRYLVYQRTARDKASGHSPATRLVFNEGNHHQDMVDSLLRKCDAVELVAGEANFKINSCMVSGRCDAIVRIEGAEGEWTGPFVLEVKSAGHPYDDYETVDDLQKHFWSARYLAQVQLYLGMAARWLEDDPMVPGGIEGGIILFKSRLDGRMKTVPVAPDPGMFAALCEKAMAVQEHVVLWEACEGDEDGGGQKTLPERIPWGTECRMCQYEAHCAPPRFNAGCREVLAGELVDACAVVALLGDPRRELNREYNPAWVVVKSYANSEECPEAGFLVGDPPRWRVWRQGARAKFEVLGGAVDASV